MRSDPYGDEPYAPSDEVEEICEDMQAQILALEAELKEIKEAAATVYASVDYRWEWHSTQGQANKAFNVKLRRLYDAITKETT